MDKKQKLLIVGGGGQARDLVSSIWTGRCPDDPEVDILGYVADVPASRPRLEGVGLDWLGTLDQAHELGATHYLLAIGYPESRKVVYSKLSREGLIAFSWLDARAVVDPSVSVGPGATVLWRASCSPNVRLLDHCSVSYGALIGHDTCVGAGSSVMPGAVISGSVEIGSGVLIGASATVLEGVRIGDDARVAAGALVNRDVAPGTTVMGVPARVSRSP